MSTKKFYVVWEGRETGIFSTWEKCQESTKGYHGAKFKSFKSRAEAEQAFEGKYEDYTSKKVKKSLSKVARAKIGSPILDSISVDASYSSKTGLMEYRGVNTRTKQVLFEQGPFKDGSINIGEFLALVHALAYLKKADDVRPIYSDSVTALSWIRDKATNSYKERSEDNVEMFELFDRAKKWIQTNDIINETLKWETKAWGEIPADFGRK